MVRFLSESSIIKAHDYLVRKYGGTPGIRDRSLLISAINQPKHAYYYLDAHLCYLAATYAYHISENQPFLDGNKRSAFVAMDKFLKLNGLKIIASNEEILEKLLMMANRKIGKDELSSWLLTVTEPI
jgi:death-on-curing protein